MGFQELFRKEYNGIDQKESKIQMGKIKHKEYFLAGLVSIITFLLYLKSLQNNFVEWDDNFYVTANPYIRTLNFDLLRWAFLNFYSYNWRP